MTVVHNVGLFWFDLYGIFPEAKNIGRNYFSCQVKVLKSKKNRIKSNYWLSDLSGVLSGRGITSLYRFAVCTKNECIMYAFEAFRARQILPTALAEVIFPSRLQRMCCGYNE